MTLFELLLLAHFVGDYLVQTEYQALHKAEGNFLNSALINHCFMYSLCFVPVLAIYNANPLWILFVFLSHMFYDRRWPIMLWRQYVNRCSQKGIESTFWLTIVVDQIFELLVLAIISIATNGLL